MLCHTEVTYGFTKASKFHLLLLDLLLDSLGLKFIPD